MDVTRLDTHKNARATPGHSTKRMKTAENGLKRAHFEAVFGHFWGVPGGCQAVSMAI